MVQHRTLGAGPLTAAAAAIAEAAPLQGAPSDPAAFMARLMDLRGSVELGQRLASLDRPRSRVTAPDPAGVARVRALVAERLSAIRGDLDRTLADPFQRRNKLPTPADALAALEETGALEKRGGRPASRGGRERPPSPAPPARSITAAAEILFAPIGGLLSRSLDRVRSELTAVREEIAPALAALGPAFALLSRLDAALLGATARGREQIEGRLIPALARSFAARLGAAVARLPDPAAPADLAPWFAAEGWIRAEIARGRAIALAVIAREERLLLALVEVA